MKGIGHADGRGDAIVERTSRRLAPPPIKAPREEKQKEKDGGNPAVWEYYHHSRWRAFDPAASAEIETAFEADKKETVVTLSTDSRWGTQYKIDFQTLQQTNTGDNPKLCALLCPRVLATSDGLTSS